MAYLHEVVDHFKLDKYIHYSSPVISADWDSSKKRWSLKVQNKADSIKAKFIFMCGGYYEVKINLASMQPDCIFVPRNSVSAALSGKTLRRSPPIFSPFCVVRQGLHAIL